MDMAISVGMFPQVILMVFFSGEEVLEFHKFDGEGLISHLFLFVMEEG